MKTFEWDEEKNVLLRRTRGVSFEDVVIHIEQGDVLDITVTHDPVRYPGQRHFVLNINGYVHYVPFVENEGKIFLMTIIPSRKHDNGIREAMPMKNEYPPEELELLDAIESGKTPSIPALEQEKARYRAVAARTLRKDQRINIRLNRHDLQELRKRAQEEGIPYQTLIASLLHKYVNGRLVDSR